MNVLLVHFVQLLQSFHLALELVHLALQDFDVDLGPSLCLARLLLVDDLLLLAAGAHFQGLHLLVAAVAPLDVLAAEVQVRDDAGLLFLHVIDLILLHHVKQRLQVLVLGQLIAFESERFLILHFGHRY